MAGGLLKIKSPYQRLYPVRNKMPKASVMPIAGFLTGFTFARAYFLYLPATLPGEIVLRNFSEGGQKKP
ncbi:MAG TPA: hypothetical protein DCL49_08465 [Candidatus Omnitrophica bacterium]|nr:hypothetical protein [Candidatus Omnitrophota bacterium]